MTLFGALGFEGFGIVGRRVQVHNVQQPCCSFPVSETQNSGCVFGAWAVFLQTL